jgi:hypothetical protein
VKVRGVRIQLEEIETHLRAAAGTDMAAAVTWPVENGSANGIMGFVNGTETDLAAIREKRKQHLQAYMLPTSIRSLPELRRAPTERLTARRSSLPWRRAGEPDVPTVPHWPVLASTAG